MQIFLERLKKMDLKVAGIQAQHLLNLAATMFFFKETWERTLDSCFKWT